MPNPLKTLAPMAAVGLSLGLFAAASTASATPIQATSGLTSPGLQVDDEIRELQRRFPETLWPPGMRYFPYQ